MLITIIIIVHTSRSTSLIMIKVLQPDVNMTEKRENTNQTIREYVNTIFAIVN